MDEIRIGFLMANVYIYMDDRDSIGNSDHATTDFDMELDLYSYMMDVGACLLLINYNFQS